MSDTVKMKHPSACSFSHDGAEIVANKKGIFDVPADAVGAALEHGFEVVTGKGSKADDEKAPEGDKPEGGEGGDAAE